MSFDYSITKLKRVKCSNSDCNHVFIVQDRQEPLFNDPGYVVKECPKCHCHTRFEVWNADYFEKKHDVVGVYMFDDDNIDSRLSSVPLGESLVQDMKAITEPRIDLTPNKSFWEIINQKEKQIELKEIVKEQLDKKMNCPKQLYLGGKMLMNGVEHIVVKNLRRKNAKKDYCLLAKRLSQSDHPEDAFNTDNLTPIHLGNINFSQKIDGLYTRNDCLAILNFFLKRWTLMSNQVVIAVPFIGFHYNNKRCKNQVLYFWAFLNSVLDMQKTLLLTRKTEFNRMKEYLNEQKNDETYDFKKYWGALDQLQAAAEEAGVKKKPGREKATEVTVTQHSVYFTSNFHSKFYAGVFKDRVEVVVGSYNVHEGDVLENLFFKVYKLEEFQAKYLGKILPDKKLLKEDGDVYRALYYTLNGNDIREEVKAWEDIIKSMQ